MNFTIIVLSTSTLVLIGFPAVIDNVKNTYDALTNETTRIEQRIE